MALDEENAQSPPQALNVEAKSDDDDEETKRIDQQAAASRRLGAYFVHMLANCPMTEDADFINSIDPLLARFDLLMRVLRLLDSSSSAIACSVLEEARVLRPAFARVCAYISFTASAEKTRQQLRKQPAQFFADRRSPLDGAGEYVDEIFAERLLTASGYALALYRRVLETTPALFREWFDGVRSAALRE